MSVDELGLSIRGSIDNMRSKPLHSVLEVISSREESNIRLGLSWSLLVPLRLGVKNGVFECLRKEMRRGR